MGDKLREQYKELVGDEGPSEDQVRDALKTLGTAVQSVVESVGAALRDPEVRSQVKEAAAGFASAVGQTFNDLGDEIRKAPDTSPAPDEDSGTGEVDER